MNSPNPMPPDDTELPQSSDWDHRRTLPMFPLGSTVFPSQVVPLHVFEDRYRQMMAEIVGPEGDSSFGIVLIDRGHEVGGGDSRVSVATKVEVVQAEEFDDGRWGVVSAGVHRLNIHEWLLDDPYPCAVVSARSVIDNGGASLADLQALLLETIKASAARSGSESMNDSKDFGFSADPHQLLDQLSALAPITEFDRQKVLEAETTSDQIELLSTALEDRLVVLRGVVD